MHVATVHSEDLSAAQAFHRSARKSTTHCHLARSTCPAQCRFRAGRKPIQKKEEEISLKRSKKTAAEEDRIFKPALSPRFQTGADSFSVIKAKNQFHQLSFWFLAQKRGNK